MWYDIRIEYLRAVIQCLEKLIDDSQKRGIDISDYVKMLERNHANLYKLLQYKHNQES